MYKRNSPNKKLNQYGMCKRNSPDKKKRRRKRKEKKKKKKSQHGMCKRNSPQKSKSKIGCVRETPQIKMKPARDV